MHCSTVVFCTLFYTFSCNFIFTKIPIFKIPLYLLLLNSKNIAAVETMQLTKSQSTNPSSPACGKICSYEWDSIEDGKYYPLLHKAVNCSNTFQRMAYSPYPVVLPPPRRPPTDLIREFTVDGKCPITHFRYFDESSGSKESGTQRRVDAKRFNILLKRDKMTNINSYRDKNVLKPALIKHKSLIQGKCVAVVGTQIPWAEAMMVNLGASSVTTIEYANLVIEHHIVTTVTPYRLAERLTRGEAVPFDTVFSYSSIEHSGLGRYGDPLSPFGDLEASAQVWCMVKPGGHFILAVPVSKDRHRCLVKWNAQRVYGFVRLQHLTANWRVLEEFETLDSGGHRIYVMQKV